MIRICKIVFGEWAVTEICKYLSSLVCGRMHAQNDMEINTCDTRKYHSIYI